VYDDNGKRCFHSTGKRNRDEAVKFCRNLQLQGKLHSRTALSFIAYTKDFFIYEKCPYIKHRLTRGNTYSRSWAKRQKKLLDTEITPHFNTWDISAITFKNIDEFIMALKNKDYSNKKINHIITTLKNIFSFAETEGLIQSNPCKGLKPFRVTSPEKGVLTKEELRELFSDEKRSLIWPNTMHYIFNYLAASTGLRLGELLALKPLDLSNDKLFITHSFNPDDGLKTTKNGKSRLIPLNKKLLTLLKEYCQIKPPDEYIFSSCKNGLKPVGHKIVYKHFKRALENIGINEEERKQKNITFQSYRHGFNSMLLQAGTPPETVRLLTGHSGPSMTAHYAHLQLPDLFEEKINCFEKNQVTTLPEYIEKLRNEGHLFPDGKRVVKSLDNVARELKDNGIQITEKFLAELFHKPNGHEYSPKACKKALNYAYTP
jgi:integrase